MKIYHYTTIETLALILKNKTIRFNRLDKVDDLEEGNVSSQGIKLGHYVYVSCWTELEEESIPLWKMYTNGCSGVRIAFDFEPFQDYIVETNDEIRIEGSPSKSKLPLSEIMHSNYFIFPLFQGDFFYRKINYVDNVFDKIKDIVQINGNSTQIALKEVGSYKHTRWSFQNESRFAIVALPNIKGVSYSSKDFVSWIFHAFINEIKAPFEFYDFSVKDSAFDTFEVVLSPSATISEKIIVQSLLKEYAPKANLRESRLVGSVKMK